jgi:hypothetical protein
VGAMNAGAGAMDANAGACDADARACDADAGAMDASAEAVGDHRVDALRRSLRAAGRYALARARGTDSCNVVSLEPSHCGQDGTCTAPVPKLLAS